jgi:hypothetical protein
MLTPLNPQSLGGGITNYGTTTTDGVSATTVQAVGHGGAVNQYQYQLTSPGMLTVSPVPAAVPASHS